jgi:uncharacterized protein (TIGR02145 family)
MMKLIIPLLAIAACSSQCLSQSVTDYDGNEYATLVIGTQVWMGENLKSLHYSDGTVINGVCSYNNSDSLAEIYGRLYRWEAAMRGAASSNLIPSGVQGVCPAGWHLPSYDEWGILLDQFGGEFEAGAKLKEADTTHWMPPNTGATNASGFTALPGGYRANPDGSFQVLGYTGFWWTSYKESGYVYEVLMGNEVPYAIRMGSYIAPEYNYEDVSVRCLKNSGATGVQNHDLMEPFGIYPNPSKDMVTIQLANSLEMDLTIYSLSGKVMIQQLLSQLETSIDISSLPAGVYILSVQSPLGKWQKRFVKSSGNKGL